MDENKSIIAVAGSAGSSIDSSYGHTKSSASIFEKNPYSNYFAQPVSLEDRGYGNFRFFL